MILRREIPKKNLLKCSLEGSRNFNRISAVRSCLSYGTAFNIKLKAKAVPLHAMEAL